MTAFCNPDDFYEEVLRTHEGLDDAASHRLNARIILLMAARIADEAALREILRQARAPGDAR